MNNENEENKNPELPSGFKMMEISAKEIDYLSERFEIRDHRDIFAWAIKLLYDISILDNGGWKLSFEKCEVDLEKQKVIYKDYAPIHFANIANLVPNEKGFVRLPLPEMLDERQKIK